MKSAVLKGSVAVLGAALLAGCAMASAITAAR